MVLNEPNLKTLGVILMLLLVIFQSKAQDIHWSQFNDNPIFQNPGNSGRFKGDYRFHGNYRDQWRSVTKPFSTLSFSADTRFEKYPKIGLGLLFFNDQAGDGTFRTIEVQASPSYQIKLTSDSTHTVRAGLQIGMNYRQVNMSKFSFDSQFDGIQYNGALATNESFQSDRNTNLSVGTGIVYEWYQNERKRISGGVALFNINKPNNGFYGVEILRDRRLNVFAKAQFKIDFDWDILPTIQLNFQGKYKEIVMGSTARYIMVDRLGEYRALYFGAFYRNKDAGYVSVGMDYQNWYAGVSYDLNFSKLVPASKVRGGIELSVRYILTRFKPKSVIHRICPDYI